MIEKLDIAKKEVRQLVKYPCLVPSFHIQQGALYWGNERVTDLSDEELLFLMCCDGTLTLRDIVVGIPDALRYIESFENILVSLPANKNAPSPVSSHPDILVVSAHGYEGFLSMAGSLDKWANDGLSTTLLSCFSQQTAARSEFSFDHTDSLALLRMEEARTSAALTTSGVINWQLPDHDCARKGLFPDDFEERYKTVSTQLKRQLYEQIEGMKPHRVYFPAGLSGNRDGTLIFRLLLDFFKQSYFPEVEFFIYEDFPYAIRYNGIDQLMNDLDRAFVGIKEHFEDVSEHSTLRKEVYKIYQSLFAPEDSHLPDHLLMRNAVAAGVHPGKKLERYFQLTDK